MTPPEESLLKPCPFCGKPAESGDDHNKYVDFLCDCGMTDANGTSVFVKTKNWQNAYCWKLLDEKDAEIKELLAICGGETEEQARLLGISGSREAKLLAEIQAYLETIFGLRKELSETHEGWQKSIGVNRQQAEVIRIARETLGDIKEGACYCSKVAKLRGHNSYCVTVISKEALDKMNRGEGK